MTVVSSGASATATVVFAFGCWYVAGAFAVRPSARILSALSIAAGMGLVAGICDVLYGWVCWTILATAAVCVRRSRLGERSSAAKTTDGRPHAIAIAVIAFVAWPSFVSPPMDGDTLIYHLPNAASWVRAHSVWTTLTHYWWYPGGSELAAATVLATCGGIALPAVGACAALALVLGVYENARRTGATVPLAVACAVALATSHVAAVQAGDLQNDVLLAALVLATVPWPEERENPLLLAMLAITKPIGWLYGAAVGSFAGKRRVASVAIVLVTIGLWWLRDAVLSPSATFPVPIGVDEDLMQSPIVVHGLDGAATLGRSSLADGMSTALFVAFGAAACVGIVPVPARRVALAALAIWITSPYSFQSATVAQLAIGASLRFGLPTMALGAIALAGAAARISIRFAWAEPVATTVLAALTLANLSRYLAIYANDGSTSLMRIVPLVVLAVAGIGIALRRAPLVAARGLAVTAVTAMLVVAFDVRARAGVAGYYADALGEHGADRALPSLIASAKATTIVTEGYPSGMVVVLRPDVRLVNLPGVIDACAFARRVDGIVLLKPRAVDVVPTDATCTTVKTKADDLIITPIDRARASLHEKPTTVP